jgi:hypothetical protein
VRVSPVSPRLQSRLVDPPAGSIGKRHTVAVKAVIMGAGTKEEDTQPSIEPAAHE